MYSYSYSYDLLFRYWYGGDFINRGGSGAGAYDLTRGGAAGTAFVANQQRPLSYRELKYLPGTNNTYFQVLRHPIPHHHRNTNKTYIYRLFLGNYAVC